MTQSNTKPYGPFKRILFCTDFSENADFAFDFALEQARHSTDCTLYLLHVVPEPDAQFWRTYVDEVENVEDKGRKDMEGRIKEAYASRVPQGLVIFLCSMMAPLIIKLVKGGDSGGLGMWFSFTPLWI